MYKITNKESGFIQYMSNKDATNFMNFNNSEKYLAEEIKTFDTENFLGFLVACIIVLILTFSFLYFGAETTQWINE